MTRSLHGLRWWLIAASSAAGLTVVAGLLLARTTGWYLGHCGTDPGCGGARIFLSYWWAVYVPALMLLAGWAHSRTRRAAGAGTRDVEAPALSPGFAQALAIASLLAISGWFQFGAVQHTAVEGPLRADARVYFSYAYNLANHGVYSGERTWQAASTPAPPRPQALVTPGYPLFLAALHPRPTPTYVLKVTRAQALMGMASVLLMFLVSRRFLPTGLAWVAGLLTALTPHLAVMSTYLLTESLFILMLFGSVLALVMALRAPSPRAAALAGLCWGLCALVRPTAQFLPVLVFLAVCATPRLRTHWRTAGLGLLAFCLVLAPWQLRKLTLPRDPTQPSLMVNFVNFGGYANFMYQERPETLGRPYAFDPDIAHTQRSLGNALAAIVQRAQDDPCRYLQWFLFGKAKYFLSWDNIDGVGDVFVYPVGRSPFMDDIRFAMVRASMHWLHWPLVLAGLLGVLLVWLKPAWTGLSDSGVLAARVVAGVFLYALAFHVVGAPLPRYGIPFRPLLFPLAMVALAAPWRWRSRRHSQRVRESQVPPPTM